MTLNTGPRDWNPPRSVIEASERAMTGYNAPPLRRTIEARFKGVARTQLPITPGIRALRDYIVSQHRVEQTYMPGRSRPMTDGQRLDAHQAGFAVDFMVSQRATGDAIANWLVEHADECGVQLVIWCANVFDGSHPAGQRIRAYRGASMHRDHPHVELNVAGRTMAAPFFRSLRPATDAQLIADAGKAGAPFADHGGAEALGAWGVAAGVGIVTLVGGAAILT